MEEPCVKKCDFCGTPFQDNKKGRKKLKKHKKVCEPVFKLFQAKALQDSTAPAPVAKKPPPAHVMKPPPAYAMKPSPPPHLAIQPQNHSEPPAHQNSMPSSRHPAMQPAAFHHHAIVLQPAPPRPDSTHHHHQQGIQQQPVQQAVQQQPAQQAVQQQPVQLAVQQQPAQQEEAVPNIPTGFTRHLKKFAPVLFRDYGFPIANMSAEDQASLRSRINGDDKAAQNELASAVVIVDENFMVKDKTSYENTLDAEELASSKALGYLVHHGRTALSHLPNLDDVIVQKYVDFIIRMKKQMQNVIKQCVDQALLELLRGLVNETVREKLTGIKSIMECAKKDLHLTEMIIEQFHGPLYNAGNTTGRYTRRCLERFLTGHLKLQFRNTTGNVSPFLGWITDKVWNLKRPYQTIEKAILAKQADNMAPSTAPRIANQSEVKLLFTPSASSHNLGAANTHNTSQNTATNQMEVTPEHHYPHFDPTPSASSHNLGAAITHNTSQNTATNQMEVTPEHHYPHFDPTTTAVAGPNGSGYSTSNASSTVLSGNVELPDLNRDRDKQIIDDIPFRSSPGWENKDVFVEEIVESNKPDKKGRKKDKKSKKKSKKDGNKHSNKKKRKTMDETDNEAAHPTMVNHGTTVPEGAKLQELLAIQLAAFPKVPDVDEAESDTGIESGSDGQEKTQPAARPTSSKQKAKKPKNDPKAKGKKNGSKKTVVNDTSGKPNGSKNVSKNTKGKENGTKKTVENANGEIVDYGCVSCNVPFLDLARCDATDTKKYLKPNAPDTNIRQGLLISQCAGKKCSKKGALLTEGFYYCMQCEVKLRTAIADGEEVEGCSFTFYCDECHAGIQKGIDKRKKTTGNIRHSGRRTKKTNKDLN